MLNLKLLPVQPPLQSLPNKLIQQRKKKSHEITTVGQNYDRSQPQQPQRREPEMLNLKFLLPVQLPLQILPNKLIQQQRSCCIIGTFYIPKKQLVESPQ